MFKVKYGHILYRFNTYLDFGHESPKYGLASRNLNTWSSYFMFIFSHLLQRFPIIFVESTSIFLKLGIRVTLDYIITLYSPLQTILIIPLKSFLRKC
jgi:hypothetical protein